MDCEEIKLLKQSEKSTVLLVRETDGEQIYVQKILKGQHRIYSELLNYPHSYLPALYEVNISDDATTVIEEYIEGQSLGSTELSEKQLQNAIKELCSVLEFLHGKGVIHRDIKPSNILLANDGHIRLIDFDAARTTKDNVEQDTRLLGTRGYAPPEQYGFAQTDIRADIYSLGVTIRQLFGQKANKLRYKRIIKKCTDLNPDRRYQYAHQVKRALNFPYGYDWWLVAGLVVVCVLLTVIYNPLKTGSENAPPNQTQSKVTPESTQEPNADEEEPSVLPSEERIVLTEIFQAPFTALDSVPINQISAEWEINAPTADTDSHATLYRDEQAIAEVRLFEDGGRDVHSGKIQIWLSPAYASEYIKLSEYLELDMSKEEVLAALEEAEQHPILPYPGMVFANEDDKVSLLYDDYSIEYFYMPDITVVEIKAYIK